MAFDNDKINNESILKSKQNPKELVDVVLYHDNNTPFEEFTLLNGKRHGSHKRYRYNGELIEDSNYKEGVFHGSYKRYHKGNVLVEACFYNNGKYLGERFLRTPEGVEQEHVIIDSDGFIHLANEVCLNRHTKCSVDIRSLKELVQDNFFEKLEI